MSASADAPSTPARLGTFLGVYTPTILTILGLMLYLRIGWVVGNAGLLGALTIIVLANSITLFTALSMSALATNMRVGVGGAYYLISRTLGLEFGGAVGIPLYLSQTLSITLYAYGLGESFGIFGPALLGEATWATAGPWIVQGIAVTTILGVTLVAARSTELTLKAQLPVLGLIGLSLVALFVGVPWQAMQADAIGGFADPTVNGFWGTFAVFFPAVTGVLAGVSLSGDLADPRRSIPFGALAAVLTGFVIYLTVPIALAFAAPSSQLLSDNLIWTRVSLLGPVLVLPGLWGAVLSSAFGSILGAPRTLQALSFDGLAPKRLAANDPATGEPVLGLRLTGAIALVAALLLPNLNTVAEWVTIFFLTTYGALNLVAMLEALVGDPGFRPTLRVNWVFSLLGFVGCLVAMFLINPLACLIAIAVEAAIFYAISRRSLQSTWGDVRTGMWLSAARYTLLQLRRQRVDPRNWRPHLLVFTNRLGDNLRMVRLASQIGRHRGVVTQMELLVGQPPEPGRIQARTAENQRLVDEEGVLAFCEVVAVPELGGGILAVTQANGFAGMQSNTVMFGFPREREGLVRTLGWARTLEGLEKSVLVHHRRADAPARAAEPKVVIWWKGAEHNGDLMLLLAHLLRGSPEWARATVTLTSIVEPGQSIEAREAEVRALLQEIRIDASVAILRRDDPDRSVTGLIHEGSAGADLVLLGLNLPDADGAPAYADALAELVGPLPEALLVHNSGPFRGRLVGG
jgi:potassium/chloride transporter 4/5/6